MNATPTDDDIIARLRSALDEVAATGGPITADAPDGSVLPFRTARSGRSPRTWLAVAAATAVLLGGASWALFQRQTPAATSGATTLPAEPTPTTAASYPWYELNLPDAVPGDITTGGTDNTSSGFTQQWVITDPNGISPSLGMLSILVQYDATGLPPDPSIYTQIDAPQGAAWWSVDPSNVSSIDPVMVWQRDDDTVWLVKQAGLIIPAPEPSTALADYVFAIQRGSFNDLLSNPDQQAEWVGAIPTNLRIDHTQGFAVGDVDAALTLRVSTAAQLEFLAGSTDIAEVSVARTRGWRATTPDGAAIVVWPIEGEWWGVLKIGPAIADRESEIIASLEPIAAVVPTTAPESASDPTSKPADAPSYVLNDPSLTGPQNQGVLDLGAGARPQSMVWSVEQTGPGVSPAYMFATAFDWGGMPYEADGATYQDVSRNGLEAVLYIGDSAATPPIDATCPNWCGPVVYFPQDDGVVWAFEATNLVAEASDPYGALVDLAFALSNDAFASGSGTTPALPTTLFGKGTPASRLYNDNYATPTGGTISLTVHDGFAPFELRDATQVTPTSVLGRPALVGTFADGTTKTVWQAADSSRWWVSLDFLDAATAVQADRVIASLELVTP
jgi:hypothetical protein